MAEPTETSLIVGLGNPGSEYRDTRHNVGFMAVDRLVRRLRGAETPSHEGKSHVWTKSFRGKRILLMKPQTFMNASGEAVANLSRVVGAAPAGILLIYDDLALPVGTIRIRKKGGGGGHNGVQSVIDCLGTEAIPRLRIGIGQENIPADQVKFVLSPFVDSEKASLERSLVQTEEAVLTVLSRGLDKAMNDHNRTIENTKDEQDVKASTKTNPEESF